jgi:uncharacterized cofD-like protein
MDPLSIVAIGGGTGLSTLLRGLKPYAAGQRRVEITAVVTVTDDGGSSGRLRRDFDILAPGDIRNCMVALSEDEALLSKLFQYRFSEGQGLKGHSFGNLFVTALTNITGDFPAAVRVSSEILASVGRIYPASADKAILEAELANGKIVTGETKISKSRSRIEWIRLRPGPCKPLPETLDAIARANLITFGPGSLFTSIIPNLLVEGIPEAIEHSTALKAYFVNLMWQPGETIDFGASDHVAAIHRHAGRELLDVVVVNTGVLSPAQLEKYAAQKALPVVNDFDKLKEMGVEVVGADLLSDSLSVRHNSDATGRIAFQLARDHQAAVSRSEIST